MEIRAGASYPAGSLTNLSPHGFILDDVKIASMEGFLQALKFKEPEMQAVVCSLSGMAAKMRGAGKPWQRSGKLHWKGVAVDRFGPDYQKLLDRAYDALTDQNQGFRKALLASGNATFSHSLGKRKEQDTVLTQREFTSRLSRARARVRAQDEHSRRH